MADRLNSADIGVMQGDTNDYTKSKQFYLAALILPFEQTLVSNMSCLRAHKSTLDVWGKKEQSSGIIIQRFP